VTYWDRLREMCCDIFRLIDGATLVLPNDKVDVNNTHRLTGSFCGQYWRVDVGGLGLVIRALDTGRDSHWVNT
jgi:hypothetical protein